MKASLTLAQKEGIKIAQKKYREKNKDYLREKTREYVDKHNYYKNLDTKIFTAFRKMFKD